MAELMHLQFGDIQGDDPTSGFENQMVVLGWSFGATQSATMHQNKGGTAAAVSVRDLRVEKLVDSASANLFKHCASGQHVETAVLTCQKAAGGEQLVYLTITMEKCIISKYDVGAATTSNEVVKETIEINCARMKMEYIPQEDLGTGGGGIEGGWDMQASKPFPE